MHFILIRGGGMWMILKIFDVATTIIQSFLIVWVTNNIAYDENKISKIKYLICAGLISSEITVFTYSELHNFVSSLLMVTGVLVILMIFYRKNVVDALLGFGGIYSLTVIVTFFLISFYKYMSVAAVISITDEMQYLIYIYIPLWIIYFFMILKRRHMFNLMLYLKKIRNPLIFILIMEYLIIVLDILRINSTIESIGSLFEAITYLATLIIMVYVIIYFAKINDNSKEVELLNKTLNEKIIELKKIKHDFGSEISGLYGLYQLEKIDKLGELLKEIVNRYQNMSDSINVGVQSSPLVISVLHYAVSEGVNVMSVDEGSYENLAVTDNDFLKLISNIIRNSVDELKRVKNPVIKYRSYDNYGGIVIMISNNGPEIPERVKEKMFQAGFSTKGNENEERGFGLSIVADIIKRCNGNISVESNKAWTTFRITIPKKLS